MRRTRDPAAGRSRRPTTGARAVGNLTGGAAAPSIHARQEDADTLHELLGSKRVEMVEIERLFAAKDEDDADIYGVLKDTFVTEKYGPISTALRGPLVDEVQDQVIASARPSQALERQRVEFALSKGRPAAISWATQRGGRRRASTRTRPSAPTCATRWSRCEDCVHHGQDAKTLWG